MHVHQTDCDSLGLLRLETGLFTFLLLFSLSTVGASTAKGRTDDLEVRVGKTVEITSSHRYCWFPTVHKFSTGEIMATMRMYPDETNAEGDFSAYCISKDGGQTWSRRYTMGAGANVDGSYASWPDGTVWELYGYQQADAYPPGQSQDLHIALTKFSHGGMEFEQTRDVPLHMSEPVEMASCSLFDRRVPDGHLQKQPVVVPWGRIIKGANGDLMAPVYYQAASDPKYSRVAIIRSTDGGKTWSQYSTVAAVKPGQKPWKGMGNEGPDEPGIVRLADHRLLVMFRTGGDGYIGEAWSSDDGKTWTPPVSIPFKGVAVRGLRLLSNGVLALTTGRPGPVVVMFSPDGTGKEWSHVTTIFSGKSTHYTDFIEVQPGKLLVVYDSLPYGWYPIPFADRESKNTIYGTFVEVRKK